MLMFMTNLMYLSLNYYQQIVSWCIEIRNSKLIFSQLFIQCFHMSNFFISVLSKNFLLHSAKFTNQFHSVLALKWLNFWMGRSISMILAAIENKALAEKDHLTFKDEQWSLHGISLPFTFNLGWNVNFGTSFQVRPIRSSWVSPGIELEWSLKH